MPRTIFFSWQSDTPASIGSEFIEQTLEIALSTVTEDAQIERAIRDEGMMVDRDTKGVTGIPPIVDTIFDKIDRATIVVPDLTFTGKRRDGRPTPNPNVLVEYGWALKALGYTRIIPVMNIASGEPTLETMPFDMRHLRHPKCTYDLPDDASEEQRGRERARLACSLAAEIGAVLRSDDLGASGAEAPKSPFPAAEPKEGEARFRRRGEPLGEAANGLAITLAEGPAMWLRVMPEAAQRKPWLITELKTLATSSSHFILPFGNEAFSRYESDQILAEDGFGIYVLRIPPGPSPCIVFVFRTGEIWAIDAYHLVVNNVIPVVEPYFISAFDNYTKFMREQLHISPPYQWVAGIEGVRGRAIEVPLHAPGQVLIAGARGACMSDTVVIKGTYAEGANPRTSLRPLFAEVYDRCAVQRPDWMDDFTWPPMRY
jgi:hypothetical protein